MSDDADIFESSFPDDELRFISFPASWNKRMHRQMGCFIYEAIRQHPNSPDDLESYINLPEVPCDPPENSPILLRILIPHAVGAKVFERLDLMGINATHLYDSHEGAAMDVINSYNYNRKSGLAWDTNSFR